MINAAGVLALTLVAASTDAVSYLGLGQVFPANMTGNTVLLAVGMAGPQLSDASRAATALGGFLVGATVAGIVACGPSRWRTAFLLALEWLLLAGVASWWQLLPDEPVGAVRYILIGMSGVAMGLQSATVKRLAVPSVSTTYITGTWTALTDWVARLCYGRMRGRPAPDESAIPRLQAAVIVAYFVAALSAGFVFHYAGRWAAVIAPCVLLAAAIAALAASPALRATR